MASIAANVAQFRFECANLDPETFKLVSFSGVEEISRLYRLDIKLVSTDPEVDFSKVINEPATLHLMRGDESSPIQGIISHFEQAGRTPDYFVYRAVMVPRLWRLTLTHQSRIFQRKNVGEIISDVLKEAGLAGSDFSLQLNNQYQTREYCVQYRETDFNFISRLMEREGIFYYFEHKADKEVLQICDGTGSLGPIEGESTLLYDDAESLVGEREVVTNVVYREHAVTGQFMVEDYLYRTPGNASGESGINGDMPGKYRDHGEHLFTQGEGGAQAKVRNEEIEGQRCVLQGDTNCVGFRSGYKFTMAEFYRPSLNSEYIVTRVEHSGSQRLAMGLAGAATRNGSDEQPEYSNTFMAIPATAPFRPARITPIPQAPLMTAKVQSDGGQYAYIDENGEYHVKMFFDPSTNEGGQASCPVRLTQPYSGPNYGIHFPNHKDTEMVIAYMNGDIDRPIALGTVPNPTTTSPSTSNNKPQNVIRTFGQHELTFDDTKGSENIYLHSTKDWTIDIVNDKNQKVGNNETLQVGNDREKKVGANQSEEIGKNKTITVGENHTESIGADASISIGGDCSTDVGGNDSLSVGGNQTIDVGGNQNESVGGNGSTSVGGNLSLSVGKNLSQTVSKDASTNVADNFTLKVGKDGKITIGKKTTIQSDDDFTITAKKKAVITVSDQLTLKCGKASIILKKNGDIQIKGGKINVEGSGNVKIKGSQIGAN